MRLLRRSLAVSVITTALDVALFALCTVTLAKHHLTAARAACALVGALANFALNRAWAFRHWYSGPASRLGRYAVTALTAVVIGTALWHLLWHTTHADPRLLQLISMALIWALFTFPMFRAWVFRPDRSKTDQLVAPSSAR